MKVPIAAPTRGTEAMRSKFLAYPNVSLTGNPPLCFQRILTVNEYPMP